MDINRQHCHPEGHGLTAPVIGRHGVHGPTLIDIIVWCSSPIYYFIEEDFLKFDAPELPVNALSWLSWLSWLSLGLWQLLAPLPFRLTFAAHGPIWLRSGFAFCGPLAHGCLSPLASMTWALRDLFST